MFGLYHVDIMILIKIVIIGNLFDKYLLFSKIYKQ